MFAIQVQCSHQLLLNKIKVLREGVVYFHILYMIFYLQDENGFALTNVCFNLIYSVSYREKSLGEYHVII